MTNISTMFPHQILYHYKTKEELIIITASVWLLGTKHQCSKQHFENYKPVELPISSTFYVYLGEVCGGAAHRGNFENRTKI